MKKKIERRGLIKDSEIKAQLRVFYLNLNISCWGLIKAGWKNLMKTGNLENFLKNHLKLTPFKQLLKQKAYPDFEKLLQSFPKPYPFFILQYQNYTLLTLYLEHLLNNSNASELSLEQQAILQTLFKIEPSIIPKVFSRKLAHYLALQPELKESPLVKNLYTFLAFSALEDCQVIKNKIPDNKSEIQSHLSLVKSSIFFDSSVKESAKAISVEPEYSLFI